MIRGFDRTRLARSARSDTGEHREFRSFLQSVGLLAGARQLAALVFVGVVLVLPNLGRPIAVEQFLWAYFGMLILTSVGGLGLERGAGLAVANGEGDARAALAPLLVVRLASAPLQVLGLWVVLAFVGVNLPSAAFLGAVVWILAVQVQLPAFAALRGVGNRTTEPLVWITVRCVEAPVLLGLAAAGAGSAVLVGAVAVIECGGAAWSLACLPGHWRFGDFRIRRGARLSWRTVGAYAIVEALAVAYLRVDLLLVGRILGPTIGAAYGLLSRILDGLIGVQNSVNFWLFADTVRRQTTGGAGASPIRAKSLVVFPRIAVVAVLPAIVCAAWLGDLVPSLAPSIPTLRLMLVAFPFLVVGAIELYARSGEGRNQAVIAVTVLGLIVNVGLNVVLLSTLGLVGAGWALVGSEVVQVIVLWAVAREHERAMLRGVLCEVLLCGGLLLVVAVSLNAAFIPLAVVAAVALVGGLLVTSRRPKTLGGLT